MARGSKRSRRLAARAQQRVEQEHAEIRAALEEEPEPEVKREAPPQRPTKVLPSLAPPAPSAAAAPKRSETIGFHREEDIDFATFIQRKSLLTLVKYVLDTWPAPASVLEVLRQDIQHCFPRTRKRGAKHQDDLESTEPLRHALRRAKSLRPKSNTLTCEIVFQEVMDIVGGHVRTEVGTPYFLLQRTPTQSERHREEAADKKTTQGETSLKPSAAPGVAKPRFAGMQSAMGAANAQSKLEAPGNRNRPAEVPFGASRTPMEMNQARVEGMRAMMEAPTEQVTGSQFVEADEEGVGHGISDDVEVESYNGSDEVIEVTQEDEQESQGGALQANAMGDGNRESRGRVESQGSAVRREHAVTQVADETPADEFGRLDSRGAEEAAEESAEESAEEASSIGALVEADRRLAKTAHLAEGRRFPGKGQKPAPEGDANVQDGQTQLAVFAALMEAEQALQVKCEADRELSTAMETFFKRKSGEGEASTHDILKEKLRESYRTVDAALTTQEREALEDMGTDDEKLLHLVQVAKQLMTGKTATAFRSVLGLISLALRSAVAPTTPTTSTNRMASSSKAQDEYQVKPAGETAVGRKLSEKQPPREKDEKPMGETSIMTGAPTGKKLIGETVARRDAPFASPKHSLTPKRAVPKLRVTLSRSQNGGPEGLVADGIPLSNMQAERLAFFLVFSQSRELTTRTFPTLSDVKNVVRGAKGALTPYKHLIIWNPRVGIDPPADWDGLPFVCTIDHGGAMLSARRWKPSTDFRPDEAVFVQTTRGFAGFQFRETAYFDLMNLLVSSPGVRKRSPAAEHLQIRGLCRVDILNDHSFHFRVRDGDEVVFTSSPNNSVFRDIVKMYGKTGHIFVVFAAVALMPPRMPSARLRFLLSLVDFDIRSRAAVVSRYPVLQHVFFDFAKKLERVLKLSSESPPELRSLASTEAAARTRAYIEGVLQVVAMKAKAVGTAQLPLPTSGQTARKKQMPPPPMHQNAAFTLPPYGLAPVPPLFQAPGGHMITSLHMQEAARLSQMAYMQRFVGPRMTAQQISMQLAATRQNALPGQTAPLPQAPTRPSKRAPPVNAKAKPLAKKTAANAKASSKATDKAAPPAGASPPTVAAAKSTVSGDAGQTTAAAGTATPLKSSKATTFVIPEETGESRGSTGGTQASKPALPADILDADSMSAAASKAECPSQRSTSGRKLLASKNSDTRGLAALAAVSSISLGQEMSDANDALAKRLPGNAGDGESLEEDLRRSPHSSSGGGKDAKRASAGIAEGTGASRKRPVAEAASKSSSVAASKKDGRVRKRRKRTPQKASGKGARTDEGSPGMLLEVKIGVPEDRPDQGAATKRKGPPSESVGESKGSRKAARTGETDTSQEAEGDERASARGGTSEETSARAAAERGVDADENGEIYALEDDAARQRREEPQAALQHAAISATPSHGGIMLLAQPHKFPVLPNPLAFVNTNEQIVLSFVANLSLSTLLQPPPAFVQFMNSCTSPTRCEAWRFRFRSYDGRRTFRFSRIYPMIHESLGNVGVLCFLIFYERRCEKAKHLLGLHSPAGLALYRERRTEILEELAGTVGDRVYDEFRILVNKHLAQYEDSRKHDVDNDYDVERCIVEGFKEIYRCCQTMYLTHDPKSVPRAKGAKINKNLNLKVARDPA